MLKNIRKTVKRTAVIGTSVLCMFCAAAPAAYAEEDTYSGRILSYGSSGTDVYALQEALYDQGYLFAEPDGWFGAYTEEAVRWYQRYNGLAETGEADEMMMDLLLYGYDSYYAEEQTPEETASWEQTTEETSSWEQTPEELPSLPELPDYTDPYNSDAGQYEALYYGDYNDSVLQMQQRLTELGYLDVDSDGYYGNYTRIAVSEFQLINNLEITGSADETTLYYLFDDSAYSFYTYEYGSYGQQVTSIQNMLISLGYLYGTADGYFGDMTYDAVVWFQEYNYIYPVTGAADKQTLDMMLDDYAAGGYAAAPQTSANPAQAAGTEGSEPADAPGSEGVSSIIYGGTYMITSSLGYQVLGVAGDSVYDGANIQLYDANYLGAQKWVLQDAGGGYYRIRNLRSWKCLDVSCYNVQQSEYDPSSWSQLWYFTEDPYGYYYIINGDGMYLSVSEGYAATGVNVDAAYAGGAAGQSWSLTETSSDTALDFEEDGTQYIGIRSFDVEQGNVTETSGYYNIETDIEIPSGGYTLSGGDNYSIGLKVMYVNSYLAQTGYLSWDYYNYTRYDDNTVWAVTQFQEDKGLYADGIVGIETWIAMGLSEYDFYNLGSYTTPLKVYAYGSSRDEYINAMLNTAAEYAKAGTAYSEGASGLPGTYVDCSGLIYQCLYAAGINPDTNIIDHARVVYEYTSYYLGHDWRMGEAVWDAQPGDLIFYGGSSINHIAIYAGGGMIYDSWPGLGVTYRDMYAPGNILKIVRVF